MRSSNMDMTATKKRNDTPTIRGSNPLVIAGNHEQRIESEFLKKGIQQEESIKDRLSLSLYKNMIEQNKKLMQRLVEKTAEQKLEIIKLSEFNELVLNSRIQLLNDKHQGLQEKIQNLQGQNKTMKSQIMSKDKLLQQRGSEFQKKISKLQEEKAYSIQKLEQNLENSQNKLSKTQIDLQKLKNRQQNFQKFKQSHQELERVNDILLKDVKNDDQQSGNKNFIQDVPIDKILGVHLWKKNQKFNSLKDDLQKQIKRLKKSHQDQSNILNDEYKKQLSKCHKNVDRLEKEKGSLLLQIEDLKTKLLDKEQALALQQAQTANMQNQLTILKEKLKEKTDDIFQLKREIKDERKYQQGLQKQLSDADKKIQENKQSQNSSSRQLRQEISNKNDEIKSLNSKVSDLERSLRRNQEEIQDQNSKMLALENELQKLKIQQYKSQSAPFIAESDILQYTYNQQDIQFLRTNIEKLTSKSIKGCKTIYRSSDLSQINYHNYIDNHPNVMFIVRLQNDRVIGGFSEEAFSPKSEGTGKAFLFCTNTKKCYYLRQEDPGKKVKPKALSYDEWYLIWGNSEIRHKFKDNLIFSNFAITTSHYDNQKDRVEDFLGEDKQVRECEIKAFELLEVFF